MKKMLCVSFAIILCIMSLAAAAEPALSMTELGSMDDFNKSIYMYCNMFNDWFGSAFGTDVSYDPTKIEYANKGADSFFANMDGVVVELNYGFNVVSARIPITGSSYNNEQILARACALMATLCYDKPTSYDDLREQYFATSECFISGTEEFYNYLKTNKGTRMSWPFETLSKVWKFYYVWEDNNMFFSTVDFSE